MSKAENYTPELTATIVEAYTAVVDRPYDERRARIAELAAETGKKERSIVAKLSREGVYVPKEKVSKVTGEKAETKEAMAERLITMNPALEKVNPENVAKMNKTDIAAFIEAFSG